MFIPMDKQPEICFACGTLRYADDPCPQRYLTPHNDAFKRRIAEEMVKLGWNESMTSQDGWAIHKRALANVRG